jgi:hypothetical protein
MRGRGSPQLCDALDLIIDLDSAVYRRLVGKLRRVPQTLLRRPEANLQPAAPLGLRLRFTTMRCTSLMLSLLTISGHPSNTKSSSSLCGSDAFSCTASDARAPPSSVQVPLLCSEAASPPTAALLLMLPLRRIVTHRAALRDHILMVLDVVPLSRGIDSSCFFWSS